ncbi:hypothetical protein [Salibacterium sp. K-3]
MKRFLNITGLVLAAVPASFLFHIYEYTQHVRQDDAVLLMPAAVIYILLTGGASAYADLRRVLLLLVLGGGLSLLLAGAAIPDDGSWFKPFGRNLMVGGTAVIFLSAVLVIRFLIRSAAARRRNLLSPI